MYFQQFLQYLLLHLTVMQTDLKQHCVQQKQINNLTFVTTNFEVDHT